MRLLHTGDWHVGKTIRGRSRLDEFEAALARVVEIATAEEVDAVLVAGDIYDQRAAAADADALIFDTLLDLHALSIPVVAIPGNHDSPLRLAALAKLLARVGTTVVPKVRPPGEGGVIEVPSRDGSEAALVACIPFVSERRFADAAGLFADPASLIGDYDEKMGEILQAMATAFRADRVNVVMGHLFIDGALVGGGEREITVGRNYAVAPVRVPDGAGYVALGHIHRPQQMTGCPAPTYYSGSLLQLDFGEKDQQRQVNVVEVGARRPARVTPIAMEVGRKLVDLPPAMLEDLPEVAARAGDAYLRVTVLTEGPVPGIADQVRELLPNALDVHLSYERREDGDLRPSLRGLEPRAQFLSYYQNVQGADPADELMGAFDHVYEEAQG